MREKLAEIFGVVLRGWDKLLCFEVLYKTAGFGILFPFLQSQMEKLPKLAGIPYLGPQNLGLILRSPLALLLAAGLLLLLAFYLL
ncbi:MAG: glycerophosphoryl diester phosphodiesterase membrane domain-containing protein, partial [Anaerotruncus rubiinfantis]